VERLLETLGQSMTAQENARLRQRMHLGQTHAMNTRRAPHLTSLQRNLIVLRATGVGLGAAALFGAVTALLIGLANGSVDSPADAGSVALIGVVLMAGVGVFAGLAAGIALIVRHARSGPPPLTFARRLVAVTGGVASTITFVLLFAVGADAPGWLSVVALAPAGIIGMALHRATRWIMAGRGDPGSELDGGGRPVETGAEGSQDNEIS